MKFSKIQFSSSFVSCGGSCWKKIWTPKDGSYAQPSVKFETFYRICGRYIVIFIRSKGLFSHFSTVQQGGWWTLDPSPSARLGRVEASDFLYGPRRLCQSLRTPPGPVYSALQRLPRRLSCTSGNHHRSSPSMLGPTSSLERTETICSSWWLPTLAR